MKIDYDPLTQYCPVRRNLEQRNYNLVSRLSALTDRLMRLIGSDHTAFAAAKLECRCVRDEVSEVRREVAEHRLAHGC